jgi:hypothetical protein
MVENCGKINGKTVKIWIFGVLLNFHYENWKNENNYNKFLIFIKNI